MVLARGGAFSYARGTHVSRALTASIVTSMRPWVSLERFQLWKPLSMQEHSPAWEPFEVNAATQSYNSTSCEKEFCGIVGSEMS